MVKGAGALALRVGVSQLAVGLTVVAMGTSAPELVVSLLAALEHSPDMALGNVVGSNVANLLLILGACAAARPLGMQTGLRKREIPFLLLSGLVLMILANDRWLSGAQAGRLDRGDGLVMLAGYAAYLAAAVLRG